ncbi:unnamed protein product [Symbiodinium sp. CCMP2592]|nr:unnamed protein product [Symbiodinium sp. CCMP2592]
MHAFEGIVGDAGQFYEVVEATQAIQEATELLHIFTCSSPQRSQRAWYLEGRKDVGNKMYVDDICLISRVYCAHCMTYAVKSIYTVPFDFSSDDDRKLVWLDKKIFLTSAELGLNTKNLHPSPPWYANSSYVRNVLLGKFRGWVEIGPVQAEWHRALLSVFYEFKQRGWNYKSVLSVLRSIYKDDYKQYAIFGIFAWRFMRNTT